MRHPPSHQLSEYLDGELSDKRSRKLEDHLLGCDHCSNLLEDLREIQESAQALPDQSPERDLWPGIAEALDKTDAQRGDVIRLHPRGGQSPAAASRRLLRFTIPQAVAAGLALAFISASAGTLLRPDAPAQDVSQEAVTGATAEAAFVGLSPEARGLAVEVARLEGILRERSATLDPATAEILRKNLQVMDQAIRESMEALHADPGNEFLENHLARSFRTKAAYLRETAAFVSQVSEAD